MPRTPRKKNSNKNKPELEVKYRDGSSSDDETNHTPEPYDQYEEEVGFRVPTTPPAPKNPLDSLPRVRKTTTPLSISGSPESPTAPSVGSSSSLSLSGSSEASQSPSGSSSSSLSLSGSNSSLSSPYSEYDEPTDKPSIETELIEEDSHPHPGGTRRSPPHAGPNGNFKDLDKELQQNFLEFLRLIKIKQHSKRTEKLSQLDSEAGEKITEQMFEDLFINKTNENSFHQKEIQKFSTNLDVPAKKSRISEEPEITPTNPEKYTTNQRKHFREAAIRLSGRLCIKQNLTNKNQIELSILDEKDPVTVSLKDATPSPSSPASAVSKKIIAISGNQTNIDVMLLAALRAQEQIGKKSSYKIYVKPNGNEQHILAIIELYEKAKELGLNPVLAQHPSIIPEGSLKANIYDDYFKNYPNHLQKEHLEYQQQMQEYIQQIAGTARPLTPLPARPARPYTSDHPTKIGESPISHHTPAGAEPSTDKSPISLIPTLAVKKPTR